MNFSVVIRPFQEGDREEVISLWEKCRLITPENDPGKDIDLKINFQRDLFLIALKEMKIAATVMAGYDGHRGWINYLGVLPEFRGEGIGKAILDHAITELKNLGCPKINLQVRNNNTGVIDFYKKSGFKDHNVISLQLRL